MSAVRQQEFSMLDMIEIEPKSPARSAVIWLHGLGADGHDFEPLVQQWQLADELGTRFVLPHAPVQPVTLNGGMRMRAWYDIYDLEFDGDEDAEGIERARALLQGLIEREHQRGISSENIVLAGFSQGGAVALHTALRCENPLAGVLVLSAYLPLRQRLEAEKRADPETLVLRMDHGDRDPVVPYRAALASRDLLLAAGLSVDFNSYSMEHSLCPAQIDSLRIWLKQRLQAAGV
jgi:phospholipase/carboxylesterase